MGVALENARLFDETQRLLKETEQRAAELAIINSVQQALAAELDIQAIYDLVGDKIREIFDAQTSASRVYDTADEHAALSLRLSSAGSGIVSDSAPLGDKRASRAHVIAHARSRSSSTRHGRHAVGGRLDDRRGTNARSRRCSCRSLVGDQARGLITLSERRARARLRRIRRAPAADAGQQHERRAGERAAVRRDPAPHARDAPRWPRWAATSRRRSTSPR